MANVTRWAPFDDIDELFKGVFLRPVRLEAAQEHPVRVKMDVQEDDKAYTRARRNPRREEGRHPGFDRRQSGHGQCRSQATEGRQAGREGPAQRALLRQGVPCAFTLAQDVDQESAQAKYENGVLELTLPKKAATATTQADRSVIVLDTQKGGPRAAFFQLGRVLSLVTRHLSLRFSHLDIRSRGSGWAGTITPLPDLYSPDGTDRIHRRLSAPRSWPRRCPTSAASTARPSSSSTAATP